MFPAHAAGLRRDHWMLPTGRHPRLTRLSGVVEMFFHSDAGVAQLARACACQAQGRRFDPGHPLSSISCTVNNAPYFGVERGAPIQKFSRAKHPRQGVGELPVVALTERAGTRGLSLRV